MSGPAAPKSPQNPDASLAELRARVLAQAGEQPAPTRAQVSRQRGVAAVLVLLVTLALFFAWGGVRSSPRPDKLVLETALGSAILAVGIALAALGRGRSMLGRSRGWLWAVVVAAPLALFAWRVLASSQYPGMMVQWAERPGWRCFAFSCALAVAPLLTVLWLRRGSEPVHPYLTAAAFGAAAGAGAWVLVDMWCPVAYVPHLLLGHVAPLLLLSVLGALVGSRILKLRKLR